MKLFHMRYMWFAYIRQWLIRMKSFVLRVPTAGKLAKCFPEEFSGIEKPVKYRDYNVHDLYALDAVELDRLIGEEELASEHFRTNVVPAIKEQEYIHETKDERPKFKLRRAKMSKS